MGRHPIAKEGKVGLLVAERCRTSLRPLGSQIYSPQIPTQAAICIVEPLAFDPQFVAVCRGVFLHVDSLDKAV